VLLAFGMVTVVMEDVNRELHAAIEELRVAHDAMENLARVDPLTETLNQHAFYSLVEDARRQGATPPEGTVAIVDIDSLKPINDAYGHAAGDESIRAVATAEAGGQGARAARLKDARRSRDQPRAWGRLSMKSWTSFFWASGVRED
jgi:predicted signal transduction protein with EAL and GGDEF domain